MQNNLFEIFSLFTQNFPQIVCHLLEFLLKFWIDLLVQVPANKCSVVC